MAIIILSLILVLFIKRINQENVKTQKVVYLFLFLYLMFLIAYWYTMQSVYGWKYGIAGSDMLRYFEGANMIKDGYSYGLKSIYWFNRDISGLSYYGYIMYLYFIYFIIYLPQIFTPDVGIFLIKFIQILLMLLSAINIKRYYINIMDNNDIKINKNSNIIIIIILTFIGIPFTAIRLLRDTFLFYIITEILIINERRISNIIKNIIFCLLSLLLLIIRSYSLIIVVPLYFLSKKNDKKSTVISLIICIGVTILPLVLRFIPVNLFGGFFISEFGLIEISYVNLLRFIFTPTISTTVKGLINSNNLISNYEGGYLPIIYFLVSVWIIFFIIIIIAGCFKLFNKNKKLFYNLIINIINISLIYSFIYGGNNEPRHKIMLLIPLSIIIAYYYDTFRARKYLKLLLYTQLMVLLVIICTSIL